MKAGIVFPVKVSGRHHSCPQIIVLNVGVLLRK